MGLGEKLESRRKKRETAEEKSIFKLKICIFRLRICIFSLKIENSLGVVNFFLCRLTFFPASFLFFFLISNLR